MRYLFTTCFIITFHWVLNAQKDNVDFQTWTDFTLTKPISQKSLIGGDIGVRGIVSENDWNQFYIRPTYHFDIKENIRLTGGIAFFFTMNKFTSNLSELRFFQESTFKWPTFNHIHFKHRIRIEERLFFYPDDSFGNENPNQFEFRTRYQLSVESKDFHIGKKNSSIYFLGAFEAFFRIGNTAFDFFINNQRIWGGFGYKLNPRFKFELNYIFQNSRIISDEGLKTTQHILRLRISYLLRNNKFGKD
jgi:uncharacterized protein DUF2490